MTTRESENNSIVPSWDGNPAAWQVYRQEVRLWKLGCDPETKVCLAARLAARLDGSARRIALQMTDDELRGPDKKPLE